MSAIEEQLTWMGGDATVWCHDGHDPKIVQEKGDVHICPECSREFAVSVDVEVL